MIPFLAGVLVGAFGLFAIAAVVDGQRRGRAFDRAVDLRFGPEPGPGEDWPYRVEARYESGPVVVRTYYDEDGEVHHTDRGIS